MLLSCSVDEKIHGFEKLYDKIELVILERGFLEFIPLEFRPSHLNHQTL
jgi:hypothetical protein